MGKARISVATAVACVAATTSTARSSGERAGSGGGGGTGDRKRSLCRIRSSFPVALFYSSVAFSSTFRPAVGSTGVGAASAATVSAARGLEDDGAEALDDGRDSSTSDVGVASFSKA